ncbi:MAG: hypothetical protein GWN01_00295, partial [Nitrosopumilaceae archaeon]|nr:hypothetical protein [Nitrosopumilaceae archaeon]NIU85784.1 hypothetical protein [Nitrosopumilaceae archaeon]NIV64618.1 hypothetical protein [Nitrosopumilaceae archaeon]NIX60026.1 hypothetical protein [Nitrosopumilaceae archaeon]
MKTVHKDIYFMIAIFLFSSWCSCERSTAPPMENQPPETYIANVPAENDTIFALVSLSWNGGDSDGFVAKYQYRYITYFLFQGDSLVQDWI